MGAILLCVTGTVGLSPGASPSSSSSPLGHARYKWQGTYFIAIPQENLVVWTAGNMKDVHAVFRNLPGAFDVWVSPDAELHVWIRTDGGVRVRRIELGTGQEIGEVAPESVRHGSHQACPAPAPFEDMIIVRSPHEALFESYFERIVGISQFIGEPQLGGFFEIGGGDTPGLTIQFGAWVPNPEDGEFDPPNEEFIFLLSGAAPPVNVSAMGSTFHIPPGQTAIYVWIRHVEGHVGIDAVGARLVTFAQGAAVVDKRYSLMLNKLVISPFEEIGESHMQAQGGYNLPTEIRAERLPHTGGHSHDPDGGNNPTGRSPFIEFSMDSSLSGSWGSTATTLPDPATTGHYMTVYFWAGSPGIGGRYRITAHPRVVAGCPDEVAFIDVKVQGLAALEASDSYILVGGTCLHHGPSDDAGVGASCRTPDNNHWGAAGLLALIRNIAREWNIANGRFRVNDMGLPWGGKFDLNGQWGPPKASHDARYGHSHGRAADISYWVAVTGGGVVSRKGIVKDALLKAFLHHGEVLEGVAAREALPETIEKRCRHGRYPRES